MNAPFTPISDADWPKEILEMRGGFAGQLNVYRLMAHHPALLRAWSELREHIVKDTALGKVRAEIVILRLAHRLGCAYEWDQHVLRGLKVGLSKKQISSMRGPRAGMDEEAALLAAGVDALVDETQLSAPLMAKLEALVGRHGVLDLMATTGMYLTLGFILKSAPPPLEDGVAAELAELAPELRF